MAVLPVAYHCHSMKQKHTLTPAKSDIDPLQICFYKMTSCKLRHWPAPAVKDIWQ